jgi:hypothetical protein
MKTYILIYLDNASNELDSKEITAENITDARHQRDNALANAKLNDLKRITVKLKK